MTRTLNLKDAAADLRSDNAARRARGVQTVESLRVQGDPDAAYAVATWLLHGVNGYPRDEKAGASYLQFAADHGVRDAIYDLGALTETQRLGAKPRRKAFNRYLTAAILGDLDAAGEVVRCLYHGIGTFADPQAAERLHDALAGGAQHPIAAE